MSLRADRSGRVRLLVHVQPGARRDAIVGLHGGRMKIRVAAPPEAGRANERLCDVIAAAFRLRRADVEVVAGRSGRAKEVALGGTTLHEAAMTLQELLKRAEAAAEG